MWKDRCFILIHVTIVEDLFCILYRFIEDGGWDVLNLWLSDFKEIDNPQLLTEILKVYKDLPVTVDLLKKNSAAKTIKQLGKSDHEGKEFIYRSYLHFVRLFMIAVY